MSVFPGAEWGNENNQNSDNEKFHVPNGFKGEGGNQRNFKLPKRTSGITPAKRISSNNDKYTSNNVHFSNTSGVFSTHNRETGQKWLLPMITSLIMMNQWSIQ